MGQGKVGNERRAMGSLGSVDGACVCVFCHGGRASRSERAQRGNWMEEGGESLGAFYLNWGERGDRESEPQGQDVDILRWTSNPK
jgi:hypothetical protein